MYIFSSECSENKMRPFWKYLNPGKRGRLIINKRKMVPTLTITVKPIFPGSVLVPKNKSVEFEN
jgi:hypothetical protein